MANLKNTRIDDSGFLKLPTGSGANRPENPTQGLLRYNTDRSEVESYTASWVRTERSLAEPVRDSLLLDLDAMDPNSYPGGGNTWFDISGNSNHATLNGASFEFGDIPAFIFNGSSDYAETSLGNTGGDVPHTIEIAFKLQGIHQQQLSSRVDPLQIGANNSTNQYSAIDLDDNKINWYFFGNDADVETVFVKNNEWNILTLAYEGGGNISARRFYFNGQKIPWDIDASGNSNLNLVSNAPVNIGRDGPRSTAYFPGAIAFVKIHNRALNENEVDQNYTYYAEKLGLRTLGTRKNPAKSGLDFKSQYPDLPTGWIWIRNEKMPNELQMYVDMVEEYGGFDFYPIQNGTNVWTVMPANNGSNSPPNDGINLGLDILYPRSPYHWRAASKFVREALRQSESDYDRYFRTTYAVFRSNSTTSGSGDGGSYTGQIMRKPNYYGSGANDWRVPDGGRWWLRDSTFGEPNGDYLNYGFLNINGRRVTWNTGSGGSLGGYDFPYNYNLQDLEFNDIASDRHHATNGYYLVSTNAKP